MPILGNYEFHTFTFPWFSYFVNGYEVIWLTFIACMHKSKCLEKKDNFLLALIFPGHNFKEFAVAGSSAGIKIHAVFVTKTSGETLKKYAGLANVEIWIVPSFENSAWSIMAISFISLLAMSAVLATCFFVRRHRIRRGRPRSSHAQEFRGMSRRVVKAMPSLIFTTALEDNCTSVTCAICLEDYTAGEKLRILPCRHSKLALYSSSSSLFIFIYY